MAWPGAKLLLRRAASTEQDEPASDVRFPIPSFGALERVARRRKLSCARARERIKRSGKRESLRRRHRSRGRQLRSHGARIPIGNPMREHQLRLLSAAARY